MLGVDSIKDGGQRDASLAPPQKKQQQTAPHCAAVYCAARPFAHLVRYSLRLACRRAMSSSARLSWLLRSARSLDSRDTSAWGPGGTGGGGTRGRGHQGTYGKRIHRVRGYVCVYVQQPAKQMVGGGVGGRSLCVAYGRTGCTGCMRACVRPGQSLESVAVPAAHALRRAASPPLPARCLPRPAPAPAAWRAAPAAAPAPPACRPESPRPRPAAPDGGLQEEGRTRQTGRACARARVCVACAERGAGA